MHAYLREARKRRTSCVRPTMMLSVMGRLMAMFQRVPPRSVTAQRGSTGRPAWGCRRIVLGIAVILLVGVGVTYVAYARDMRAIRARLAAGSQIVETRHGPIEYTTWGAGPPVLVIHGAGGGYDQGVAIAQAYGGAGFHWISPSRFGYLRTPLPDDASTAAQADALADLLDALEIEQVAILGMSGGVPPALQFAQRYPERTTALALLSSAPYTPLTADEQNFPLPIWIYAALFSSDFPYWLLQQVSRSSLEPMFDITPALRAAAPPEEQPFIAGMVDAFQPVTARSDGMQNEGAAIDPAVRYRLEEITVPTLVIHAKDDQINPFTFGEYTAQNIPGAQFMPLDAGGHLLLGHHAEVHARVRAFLRENTT